MYRILMLFLVMLFTTRAISQTYWQQRVEYTIDVKLDTSDKSLDGFLTLNYFNNSPDTLHHIWFHLWPNAYKNDRTAFSEQQLQNGSTDFYFAKEEEKGYIHRLDFHSGTQSLNTEDDSLYIDMIKVILNEPLAPGTNTTISTPFRVKLPKIFSRSGYLEKEYSITQWYPKPAVYDREGWHPMPYLDQGEFYSSFGSFDIRITVPEKFIIAATGNLQNEDELYKLRNNAFPKTLGLQGREIPMKTRTGKKPVNIKKPVEESPNDSTVYKTLHYLQDNVHDFAWFASMEYLVDHDTLVLGNRIIDLFAFYFKDSDSSWQQATKFIKDALFYRSELLGEYPYDVASVVATSDGAGGGMEYPTITKLGDGGSARMLDYIIEHELGHNWFYGILASNERRFPWMDEGMNTYYDSRYMRQKYGSTRLLFPDGDGNALARKLPEDEMKFGLDYITEIHKDQPVNTPSADFTPYNYALIAYSKAGLWMEKLEEKMGTQRFDSAMKTYYDRWKFKHPYPEDFRIVMEEFGGEQINDHFELLNTTGSLNSKVAKKIKPVFLFNFRDTDKYHYINIFPLPGYNYYDGLMLGPLIHNYSISPSKFRFAVLPLYGIESGKIRGIGTMNYTWYKKGVFDKINLGVSGAGFSMNSGIDSTQQTIQSSFRKIVPSLKLVFNASPRSSIEKYLEWKTFFIGRERFQYQQHSIDSVYYPFVNGWNNTVINQLKFSVADYRKLYPWSVDLQFQQSAIFYRSDFNARYFFNYKKFGGLDLRFFAAAFAYAGQNSSRRAEAFIYQPKLTAVRGNEDYTYSDFFTGRNEFDGFHSQQIMNRDGGLKLRTDLFSGLQGRSDKWVAAINLKTTIPDIFPVRIPLRVFFDAGTYSQAWTDESATSRFLFAGGLQISLFNELVNVYAPIVYSKVFRDSFNSVPEENSFLRRLSFSIDIHRLNLRRMSSNQIPF